MLYIFQVILYIYEREMPPYELQHSSAIPRRRNQSVHGNYNTRFGRGQKTVTDVECIT